MAGRVVKSSGRVVKSSDPVVKSSGRVVKSRPFPYMNQLESTNDSLKETIGMHVSNERGAVNLEQSLIDHLDHK